MKMKYKMRRGFTLVELLVVIAIIATLAGVGVPVIIAQQKKGHRSEAVANAKSIGLAMFNFEQDYGTFPSAGEGGTATQVQENNTGSGYTFGTQNSNDYFRQLIAAGHTDSEKIFYAKAPYSKKPDNVIKGDKCLAAGEVGFAYIMASQNEPVPSSGNSGRPLVVAAVYNGATDGTFDPDVYDNRYAVVLRLDQSVSTIAVRPSDKKALVGGGKTLLQGGSDETVWGTDINPIIKAPKKSTGN